MSGEGMGYNLQFRC